MIDIKIYTVMGEVAVQIKLSGEQSRTIDAGTWYGFIGEADPVTDLVEVLNNALRSIDSWDGDVARDVAG